MTLQYWLEIRPVSESPQTLRPLVSAQEWETAATIKSASRRAEWLTWRAVTRERLGAEVTITYDSNGAPMLEKERGYLSVSHTIGWVAVVWAAKRCAIDIEHCSRDLSHLTVKFISVEERALSDSTNPLFPISVWCAKEALYKYGATAGLDFIRDIRITSSDIAAGRMTGRIKVSGEVNDKVSGIIEIELLFRDGLVIATIR